MPLQWGLRSGGPSSMKLLTPEPGRGDEHQPPVFGLYEKAETQKQAPSFCIGSIAALSLRSRSTLPARGCLLSSFETGRCPWPHGTAWVCQRRRQNGLLAPDTTSLIRPLSQGSSGPLRLIRHGPHGKDCQHCGGRHGGQRHGREPRARECHGSLEGRYH